MEITQDDIDDLKIKERITAGFSQLIDTIKGIDDDLKKIDLRITLTGTCRMDIDTALARVMEKVDNKFLDWQKYDNNRNKNRVVGPDFKFHTFEEASLMFGHKLKGY